MSGPPELRYIKTAEYERLKALESKLGLVYGLLWHVNNCSQPTIIYVYEARKILRDALSYDGMCGGINAAEKRIKEDAKRKQARQY